MFRDQRDFRAIAFRSTKISSLDDAWSLLPHRAVKRGDDVLPELAGEDLAQLSVRLDLLHAYYFSTQRFTSLDDNVWQTVATRHRGRDVYRYDMYLLGIRVSTGYVCVIAVPFYMMALGLFGAMEKASRGRGIRYQKVNLDQLVQAVRANRHMGGDIRLTRVEMQIQGESDTRSVMLGGPDVPHSRTYASVLDSLESLELLQRRCRLSYDNHRGGKFSLETDRYGNYWFRVAKGARNLPYCSDVFGYLYDEKLMQETLAYPFHRESDADRDGRQ